MSIVVNRFRRRPAEGRRACTGSGRSDSPIRYVSTACAALRPSAMAHTISDAPRWASPQTNTPAASVCQSDPHGKAPRRLSSRPSPSSSGMCSTPSNPIASNANSQGISSDCADRRDVSAAVGVAFDLDLGDLHGPQRAHARRRGNAAPRPRSGGHRPRRVPATGGCAARSATSAMASAIRRGTPAARGCSPAGSPTSRPAGARCRDSPRRCRRRR